MPSAHNDEGGIASSIAAAVEFAAKCNPQDQPNNDDPPEYDPRSANGKPSPGKAKQQAIAKLRELMETDPVFAGLSMHTDGLHFYVPPPLSYYLAQINTAIGFVDAPDSLEQSAAEIRIKLQRMVAGSDYSVGKNCCNKPLASWQLERIETAYLAHSIPLDITRYQSLSKIRRYTIAHNSGEAGGMPFRIDGVFLEDGIVVQNKRFNTFQTSTGYTAFKKNGKQFTLITIEKLAFP